MVPRRGALKYAARRRGEGAADNGKSVLAEGRRGVLRFDGTSTSESTASSRGVRVDSHATTAFGGEKAFLIDAQLLDGRAPDHGAQTAIADGQCLLPLIRRLLIIQFH